MDCNFIACVSQRPIFKLNYLCHSRPTSVCEYSCKHCWTLIRSQTDCFFSVAETHFIVFPVTCLTKHFRLEIAELPSFLSMQMSAYVSSWCRGVRCPPPWLKQDQMLGQMCSMSSRFLRSPLGLHTAPKLCVKRNLPSAGGTGSGPANPALKQLYDIKYIVFDSVLFCPIQSLLRVTGWWKTQSFVADSRVVSLRVKKNNSGKWPAVTLWLLYYLLLLSLMCAFQYSPCSDWSMLKSPLLHLFAQMAISPPLLLKWNLCSSVIPELLSKALSKVGSVTHPNQVSLARKENKASNSLKSALPYCSSLETGRKSVIV